jgi:hypothetical protein
MTTVKKNFMTKGLSGKYDENVVFRQWKGRTIFAHPPTKNEKMTERQMLRCQLFLEAVDYASLALKDPELKEAYRKMAPLGSTAYNMAVADYLTLPRVEKIDTGGYSGVPGDLITIVADDKYKVKSVAVKIVLANNTLVEEGEAVQVTGGRLWIYTATEANPDITGTVITATASDVPNHQASGSVIL